jgi:hypothetical protein|nr:MAG TPA: hypothetical protein [Bacteriophage sp.]
MASTTDNFNLDLYDTGDPAALTDQYNSAIRTIDTTLLTINGNATAALNSAKQAMTETQTINNNLAALGVTDSNTASTLKNKIDTTASDLAVTTEKANNANTQAETNKTDIAAMEANLTALGANSVGSATKLKEKIDTLNALSHMVIIGDSFSTTTRDNVWWQRLPDICKTYTAHSYATGGAGFIQDSTSSPGNTFTQQIDKAVADNAYANDNVGKVIIYGGYNDWTYNKSADDEKTAVSNCYKKAITKFPNADIILCFMNAGYMSNQDKYNTIKKWVKAIQSSLHTTGIPFVNSLYWLAGYTDTVFEGDKLHPNNIGEGIIAAHMAGLIMGYENSPERLINISGDPQREYYEMWFNSNTGVVTLTGKNPLNNITGTGQQKIATPTYMPTIGNANNFLYAGSFYMSGSQASKVRAVTFAQNGNVYANISEAFTNPETLVLYYNFTYHI